MVTEDCIGSGNYGITEYFTREFYSKGTLKFDCINICICAYLAHQ